MGGKLSKIEKLVKGSLQIAKYGTYAGVISSLGCIYSVPNPFSVSPDGRYVTTVIDESGDFRFEERSLEIDSNGVAIPGDLNAYILRIDTKTKEMKLFPRREIVDDFVMLSSNEDYIAYMAPNPEDMNSVDSVIMDEDKSFRIKNAGYPALLGDSNWVAYSKITGWKDDFPLMKIRLRNLENGYDRGLNDSGIEGIVSGCSPDLKHISFLSMEGFGENEDSKIYLEVSDMHGNNRKRLSEFTIEGLNFPRWIDNDRMVFQMAPVEGEDGEIFIIDRHGRKEQVTDNESEELFPQMCEDGRLFYLEVNEKDSVHKLFYARKNASGWVNHDTSFLSGEAFVIPNNQTMFYAAGCGEFCMRDLSSKDSEVVNLSALLREKYEVLGIKRAYGNAGHGDDRVEGSEPSLLPVAPKPKMDPSGGLRAPPKPMVDPNGRRAPPKPAPKEDSYRKKAPPKPAPKKEA